MSLNEDNTTEKETDVTYGSGFGVPIAYILFGLLVASENFVLIYTILRNSHLHTTNYFFTASLGVTDLCVGFLSITSGFFRLPGILERRHALTVQMMFSIGLILLSGLHMSAIAVERWLYISRPFFYNKHITNSFVIVIIVSLWIEGFCHTLLFLLAETQIYTSWPTNVNQIHDNLKIFAGILFYMITVGVACLCYGLIFNISRKQRRKIADVGFYKTSKEKRFDQSIMFFLAVFGVYLAMTLGAVSSIQIDVFIPLPPIVFSITNPLMYLNSGCNFYILITLDKRFKVALKKSLGFKSATFERSESTRIQTICVEEL